MKGTALDQAAWWTIRLVEHRDVYGEEPFDDLDTALGDASLSQLDTVRRGVDRLTSGAHALVERLNGSMMAKGAGAGIRFDDRWYVADDSDGTWRPVDPLELAAAVALGDRDLALRIVQVYQQGQVRITGVRDVIGDQWRRLVVRPPGEVRLKMIPVDRAPKYVAGLDRDGGTRSR